MTRIDPGEAEALWTGLVTGELAIVDAREVAGRRVVVARRAGVGAPCATRLTPEESAAVWLASEGHALKVIAAELDVSIAVVARRLKSALRKLGLASRRELLQRLGAPPP